MSAEWVIGVLSAVITVLLATVAWFIKRFIIRKDTDSISTAEALLRQGERITRVEVKVDAVHGRMDDIFDIVKGLMK